MRFSIWPGTAAPRLNVQGGLDVQGRHSPRYLRGRVGEFLRGTSRARSARPYSPGQRSVSWISARAWLISPAW